MSILMPIFYGISTIAKKNFGGHDEEQLVDKLKVVVVANVNMVVRDTSILEVTSNETIVVANQ